MFGPEPVKAHDGLALHNSASSAFRPITLSFAAELLQADLELLAARCDN